MKKIRSFLFAIIPLAFIACSDGSNQGKQKMDTERNDIEMDDDVNKTPSVSDTISQGSVNDAK